MQNTKSIPEIKFDNGEDPLIVSCYTFNENEDRFGFVVGKPNEELNNEGEYHCTFLDNNQAKQLIKFLTENLK